MSGFYDQLDQTAKKESSGGGYIGKIEVQIGYKIFVSGMSNPDSFFPIDVVDDQTKFEKNKEKALELARAALDDAGLSDKRPNFAVQFILAKDSVLNRDVSSWTEDRYIVHPTWTDDYKEIVRQRMEEAGIKGTGTYWGRMTWMETLAERYRDDDPSKKELFAYIAETYKNKGEAKAAAEAFGDGDEGSGGSTDSNIPPGFEKSGWDAIKDDVISEVKEGNDLDDIAEDWEVDLDWLKANKDKLTA